MQDNPLSLIRPLSDLGKKQIAMIEARYQESLFTVVGRESVPEMADPSLYQPREMSPEQYASFNRAFWMRAYREQQLSLTDLTPYRIKAVWRITRFLAILRNRISTDEFLFDMEGAWDDPVCYRIIDKVKGGDSWLMLSALEQFGLLPPELPEGAIQNGVISEDYTAARDPELLAFLEGVRHIIDYLGIRRGSREDRDQGRLGLLGISDPALTRMAWPSPEAIQGYEMVFVEEAMAYMVENGQMELQRWLLGQHGLKLPEIKNIVGLVRSAMNSRFQQTDVEEDRTMMVLRLEDYVRRARASLDLKSELNGLKQLVLVQGLGRTEPRDAAQEFVDVVRKVAQDLPSHEKKALTGGEEGEIVDAHFG